jgi:hypothetical protein
MPLFARAQVTLERPALGFPQRTCEGDCINAYCKAWDAPKQYSHGKMGAPPPWLIILEPQISAFCSSSD